MVAPISLNGAGCAAAGPAKKVDASHKAASVLVVVFMNASLLAISAWPAGSLLIGDHIDASRLRSAAKSLPSVEAAAEQVDGFVKAGVEQHVVLRHVEVAVTIEPRRLNLHHRRDERSKEHRLQIDTVQHDGTSQAHTKRNGMARAFYARLY